MSVDIFFSRRARTDQWHKGIPLIVRNPIGHGIGMAGITLDYHSPGGLLTIDSYWLANLLEYGILGFLIFFGMVFAGVIYAARSAYDDRTKNLEYAFLIPASVSLLVWTVIKIACAEQGNHPIVFMILGMIVALVYRQSKQARELVTSKS